VTVVTLLDERPTAGRNMSDIRTSVLVSSRADCSAGYTFALQIRGRRGVQQGVGRYVTLTHREGRRLSTLRSLVVRNRLG
jgi:hypothetical protein